MSGWATTLHELKKLDEAYLTKRHTIIAKGMAQLKKEADDAFQRQLRTRRAAVASPGVAKRLNASAAGTTPAKLSSTSSQGTVNAGSSVAAQLSNTGRSASYRSGGERSLSPVPIPSPRLQAQQTHHHHDPNHLPPPALTLSPPARPTDNVWSRHQAPPRAVASVDVSASASQRQLLPSRAKAALGSTSQNRPTLESSSPRWRTSDWHEPGAAVSPNDDAEGTAARQQHSAGFGIIMPPVVEVAPFVAGMLSIHQGVLLMSWKQRYCVLRRGVLYASSQGEQGPFEPTIEFECSSSGAGRSNDDEANGGGGGKASMPRSKVVCIIVDVTSRAMATVQGFEFSVLCDVSYSAECKLLPHVEAGETVALRFAAPTYRESAAWAKAIESLSKR